MALLVRILGSCFPQSFGGSCSGTPSECQDCNKRLNCQEGGGSEGGSNRRVIEISPNIRGSNNRFGGNDKNPTDCKYECTNNGGCKAKYIGPPRKGYTSGSCFPESFGGGCSGTPPECQDCNQKVSCSKNGIEQIKSEGNSNKGI